MLHFQDNEEYKIKRTEIILLNKLLPNWMEHLSEEIPFNKKDFMDFLNFVKEEENIEYSKILLKICEYFGASQEDLDKIKSKLTNLFMNFWENVDQILELDFEEVKKGLENIDIPKDKTKEYINFIGKAFKKYGRKASICLSRINESDFGLNENY